LHLAPPLLAKKDAQGKLVKSEYGAWVLTAMSVLAKFKFLRGTLLDPFGWTEERKLERQLLAEYVALVQQVVSALNADNHAQWLQVLSLPQQIRGFGHVKLASTEHYRRQLAQALPDTLPEAQILAMAT
jgi:indolepyruvate ferredoxin oxidoreductase